MLYMYMYMQIMQMCPILHVFEIITAWRIQFFMNIYMLGALLLFYMFSLNKQPELLLKSKRQDKLFCPLFALQQLRDNIWILDNKQRWSLFYRGFFNNSPSGLLRLIFCHVSLEPATFPATFLTNPRAPIIMFHMNLLLEQTQWCFDRYTHS